MALSLQLVSASVQNLRGYRQAKITFPNLRILVGENNEGKSSLLKMVHRLITEMPAEIWSRDRGLSDKELEFWMPANNVARKARRLELEIRVNDGRLAKRYKCKKGSIITLRFGVAKVDGRARLNIGAPRRGEQHDAEAAGLLARLQQQLTLVLIPPIRDASRSRYTQSLLQEVRQALESKLLPTKRGGTPREYRDVRNALGVLGGVVEDHSTHFSVEGESVLSRMIRKSHVRLDARMEDLVEWMVQHMAVVLSTGDHDELMVSPREVGNGLQSLIDLSLAIARNQPHSSKKDLLIFVEEPESFLHPSAQRDLMASIRAYCELERCRMVLTTHSPIILDESRFPQVALVRKHRIFEPTSTDDRRDEINTHMICTQHAEVFFADAVLLVEGVSDFAYFYSLLRRLRGSNPSVQELAKIHIQAVGSKTAFAPWLNLFESYAQQQERPISYVCLVDADALDPEEGEFSAVERALQHAGQEMPTAARDAAAALTGIPWSGFEERLRECGLVNEELSRSTGFGVLPLDLEWEIVRAAGAETLRKIAETLQIGDETDRVKIARKMGSKAGSGKKSDGAVKPPHIFATIAMNTPKVDVSAQVSSRFDRLLHYAGGPKWADLML